MISTPGLCTPPHSIKPTSSPCSDSFDVFRQCGHVPNNYGGADDERKIFEFIIEIGTRLRTHSLTIGYAAVYCYRVLMQPEFPKEICPYTVAGACMLVSGKVNNDTCVNTRDVMNISYSILHQNKPMLEIGGLSYALRESLIEMELVLMRFLRFKLVFDHPHQEMVLILRILRDWYPTEWEQHSELDRLAATILRDLYVHPRIVIDHRPKTLAIAAVSMALSAVRLSHISDKDWAPAFYGLNDSFDARRLHRLKQRILIDVYQCRL